jgi:hypothetical protein
MDWELAKEATEVGALLVPVYAIVREALDGMKFKNEKNKEYISVFVSGALYPCRSDGHERVLPYAQPREHEVPLAEAQC